jgi:phosphoesterase RecJ-like protein
VLEHITALKQAIDGAKSILVASHQHPDGDAIGAVLALKAGLEALGKQVTAVSSDRVPNNLRFLPDWESIQVIAEDAPPPQQVADLAIMVDVSVVARLGRAAPFLEAAKTLAVVDHHQPSDDPPGDIRVIDPKASATCLILYLILPELGIDNTPAIAQCLLTGIATDTGSFRFGNTDPISLDAASHLVALGANLTQINEEVWEKKPLSAINLLRAALNHMELHSSGQIATSYLANDDYAAAGATDEDSEGIVNEIGRVRTVMISAMFREPKPGKIRVSVRSRGAYDVSAVCRLFGGGGHVNAAGCTFDTSMEEAIAALLPALEECLASS